tara:strand:- start:114 stop:260 length:147 start_codon:yes stop_codon:yes gene_type:complete
MFNQKPTLIMSFILMTPDPKTIAFGGVATGSMKAQDAAIVAPIIKMYG